MLNSWRWSCLGRWKLTAQEVFFETRYVYLHALEWLPSKYVHGVTPLLVTHGDGKNLKGKGSITCSKNGLHHHRWDVNGRKDIVWSGRSASLPGYTQELLGGCSCLLIGNYGQLPPETDLPHTHVQPTVSAQFACPITTTLCTSWGKCGWGNTVRENSRECFKMWIWVWVFYIVQCILHLVACK